MPSIRDYYEYAKLAAAAYVDLTDLAGDKVAAAANNSEKLPLALAKQMFDETSDEAKNSGQPVWTIPDYGPLRNGYHGNDPTGYAATLFEKGGQKVLAIRGTEPTGDQLSLDLFKADLGGIGILGLALAQAVSMVNHIQRLRAPEGSDVEQLVLHTSTTEPPEPTPFVRVPVGVAKDVFFYFTKQSATGLGLIGANERIVVTGHSLGGHLAALAAAFYPDLVSDCYTYNAPGFDPDTTNWANLLPPLNLAIGWLKGRLAAQMGEAVNELPGFAEKLTAKFIPLIGNQLGLSPASGFAALPLHTLESEDLAPADDHSVVASFLTGDQALGAETFITTERNSHLIEPFMDSLALHALLYRMNRGLTLGAITELYKAASHDIAGTQEKLVEALYKLIKGETVELIAVDAQNDDSLGLIGIGAGNINGRRDYYDRLVAIENIVAASPSLRLESLVNKSRDQLVALAKTDIAYRYALEALNPFALIGDAALYAPHNLDGHLDAQHYSDLYLQDRAALLSWKNQFNTQDNAPVGDTHVKLNQPGEQYLFEDRASGLKIRLGNDDSVNAVMSQPADDFRHIVFGTEAGEEILGHAKPDHLYGGGGDDVLDGGEGSDRLEGGLGADSLTGANGNDTLVGGAGDDRLNGRAALAVWKEAA